MDTAVKGLPDRDLRADTSPILKECYQPMSEPESLGLMSTCRKCGEPNRRTGEQRLGPVQSALGGHSFRIRSEEYVCTNGHRVWGEVGTEDETPPR